MSLGKPSSFRRILLSRLFFLSVPILLVGVYVTYSKARSAFIESANHNLTESAVRKGEIIAQSINEAYANLTIASDLEILKSDSVANTLIVISHLTKIFPENILCVHLNDPSSSKIIASNCNEVPNLTSSVWPQEKQNFFTPRQQIKVEVILPSDQLGVAQKISDSKLQNQLKLWLTAPVYDLNNRLRYTLTVKTAILNQEALKPSSLAGYPIVINEEGIILNHVFPPKIKQNIEPILDKKILAKIFSGELDTDSNSIEPSLFKKNNLEFLVGYSSIEHPINRSSNRRWLILAAAPISDALYPLKDIQRVLVIMTVVLISATFLVTLYMSRELALPLENIRDYALKKEDLQSQESLIENFHIKELNQLSLAINEMVTRLRNKGEEIVSAWQEAKSANQLKSEFLATTSHELRTPLNGIINCIRLVKDDYCDSKAEEKEFLQQADYAATHLLEIINDVLDISKIEAGKISVDIKDFELVKIIDDVINMQAAAIKSKGLTFRDLIQDRDIYVKADPAKLKQILLNILGNAVKFTDHGIIEIQVLLQQKGTVINQQAKNLPFAISNNNIYQIPSSKTLSSHGSDNLNHISINLSKQNNNHYACVNEKEAVIIFRDTGIGIALEQQNKLFSPFVMADGSTTRKFGGTGLGLAISYNLLKLMNGTINLYSPGKGKGTTVVVTLPLGEQNLTN